MLETSARLLRLLVAAADTAATGPAPSWPQRLEVDARTVRRDIERLRGLGYPVHATAPARPATGSAPERSCPPLLLDDDEAVAVAVGLRTAAGGTVTGIEETSLRALAKLEQVLPSRLRHRVNRCTRSPCTVPATGPTVDPERADRHRHRLPRPPTAALRLPQPQRHQLGTRHRTVTDWSTPAGGGTWWAGTPTGATGAPSGSTASVPAPRPALASHPDRRPTVNLADYLTRGVSTAPYRYQARITLHAPAETAAERIPPTVGVIEAVDSHTCLLHTGSNSLDELAIYVALFGFRFQIHGPPELIAHIRDLASRLTDAVR